MRGLKLALQSLAKIMKTSSPRKTSRASAETFGKRLARLRKIRRITQEELAEKLSISPRMMAYYEAQTDRPPAHLLGRISQVLNYSTDVLLGVEQVSEEAPANMRFWRKLRQAEELPPSDRRAVLQYIDALLARRRLAQKRG